MNVGSGGSRNVTCYAGGEGGWMQYWQELRGRSLGPLLAGMARAHITADHLTFLSLVAGLGFCPVFLSGAPVVSMLLLLIHSVLDGLDGPLARFTGRASSRGSFTDTLADQVVVGFTTVALIHSGTAGVWPGGLYLFFYCCVVAFAMVRNALQIPYSWLVRPRLLVYAWLPVELYFWRGSLNWVLAGFALLLAFKTFSGFVRIRRRI